MQGDYGSGGSSYGSVLMVALLLCSGLSFLVGLLIGSGALVF